MVIDIAVANFIQFYLVRYILHFLPRPQPIVVILYSSSLNGDCQSLHT